MPDKKDSPCSRQSKYFHQLKFHLSEESGLGETSEKYYWRIWSGKVKASRSWKRSTNESTYYSITNSNRNIYNENYFSVINSEEKKVSRPVSSYGKKWSKQAIKKYIEHVGEASKMDREQSKLAERASQLCTFLFSKDYRETIIGDIQETRNIMFEKGWPRWRVNIIIFLKILSVLRDSIWFKVIDFFHHEKERNI